MRLICYVVCFIFPIISFAQTVENKRCPDKLDSQSYETKNFDGNSNYSNPKINKDIEGLVKEYNINKNTPVLDVGGGYGDTTYALLRLGFDDIYLNDLSALNLTCAIENLNDNFGMAKTDIKLIPGNINDDTLIGKLPNNHFGLIIARNVLQFFDSENLNIFLLNMRDKMSNNGLIYFVVEQGFNYKALKDLESSMADYQNIQKLTFKYFRIKLKYCNKTHYANFPSDKQFLFYPCDKCVIKNSSQYVFSQLYTPTLLKMILERYGFQTLSFKIKDDNGTKAAYFELVAKYVSS